MNCRFEVTAGADRKLSINELREWSCFWTELTLFCLSKFMWTKVERGALATERKLRNKSRNNAKPWSLTHLEEDEPWRFNDSYETWDENCLLNTVCDLDWQLMTANPVDTLWDNLTHFYCYRLMLMSSQHICFSCEKHLWHWECSECVKWRMTNSQMRL